MTNEEILELTANIVSDMLDIDVPEIRYLRNAFDNTLGFVNPYFPNIVFLDMEAILRTAEYDENIATYISIVALIHELRHLWQDKNNWNYEYDMPYEQRKAELDADAYAKYHVKQIINEVCAKSVA